MTFSFFILIWIGWSAMVLGWPEKAGRRVVKLAPGFVGEFKVDCFLTRHCHQRRLGLDADDRPAPAFAVAGPGPLAGGLTALWMLLMSLWLPWIEYGKELSLDRRRPESRVAGKLRLRDRSQHLGCKPSADRLLGGRAPEGGKTSEAKRCDWMVTIRDASQSRNLEINGWIIAAEMRRPSERSERFVLYRRAR